MTQRINISVSETAVDVLEAVAKEQGLTKSAFIEKKILESAIPRKYLRNNNGVFGVLSRDLINYA